MIEILLREERVPLDLSGDVLTVLSIEREDGGEIPLCEETLPSNYKPRR